MVLKFPYKGRSYNSSSKAEVSVTYTSLLWHMQNRPFIYLCLSFRLYFKFWKGSAYNDTGVYATGSNGKSDENDTREMYYIYTIVIWVFNQIYFWSKILEPILEFRLHCVSQ